MLSLISLFIIAVKLPSCNDLGGKTIPPAVTLGMVIVNKGNNKITELRAILQGKVKTHKYINRQSQSTNDSTAEIGMNFAYIAINVRNFNRKVEFRENAISLNIKQRIYLLILRSFRI